MVVYGWQLPKTDDDGKFIPKYDGKGDLMDGRYEMWDATGGETSGKSFKIKYGAGDALEPFYYRVLYALRDNRRYTKVMKVKDTYNISPNTQQFSYTSSNFRQEVTSASGLLGQIGQIAKGIVAMKKDQQRINECLKYFDDKGKPDELTLKGLWLDFVDSKTGPASLTQASQKLEFFVARDWFFKIDIPNKEILNDPKKSPIVELQKPENGGVPTNVITFLTRKFDEYLTWKPLWQKRLKEMNSLITQQVKTSYESINLYRKWLQPMLKNINVLEMTVDPNNPDLLKIGGTLYSDVQVSAWDKIKPQMNNAKSMTYEVSKDADKKPFGSKGICKYNGKPVPFMPLLYFTFALRSGPQGYMETIVEFKVKIYDQKKFEELFFNKWTKDPVQEWIDNLMLKEELKENLGVEEEKKENAKKEEGKLLELLVSKLFNFKKIKFMNKKKKGLGFDSYKVDVQVAKAKAELGVDLAVIYFVVKKGFGMIGELSMYR